MTTKRIYYDDAFLQEFSASVVSVVENAGTWRVVLDQTAFYPTSGGQPNDFGTLGEALVREVVDEGDEIVHVVDRPVQGNVAGRIDWMRRFDHMQQHTGQHLLSAVLQKEFGLETVSFHLGDYLLCEESSTIDLRGAEPSIETRMRAAEQTNRIIFEDRPVNVKYGTMDELRALGVRKEVKREGVLRAIEIEGVELQPCGGTHVARTGQIGVILLRRCTKIRQDWRLEFLCGRRAAKAAEWDDSALRAIAESVGSARQDVVAAVSRALTERDSNAKTARVRAERMAEIEANLIVRDAPTDADGLRVSARVFEGTEALHVQLLATALAKHEKTVALFARRECGHIFFGQGPGVGKDMNTLLKKVLAEVGGKGGGAKDFARGALANPAAAQAAIDMAKKALG